METALVEADKTYFKWAKRTQFVPMIVFIALGIFWKFHFSFAYRWPGFGYLSAAFMALPALDNLRLAGTNMRNSVRVEGGLVTLTKGRWLPPWAWRRGHFVATREQSFPVEKVQEFWGGDPILWTRFPEWNQESTLAEFEFKVDCLWYRLKIPMSSRGRDKFIADYRQLRRAMGGVDVEDVEERSSYWRKKRRGL